MTWTVFEHKKGGHNATGDIAPGRGGYTYVMVPVSKRTAIEWWDERVGGHPAAHAPSSNALAERAVSVNSWAAETFEDEQEARRATGEKTLEQGGIGAPMTEVFEWSELRSRLDVWVVDAETVHSDLEESDEWEPPGNAPDHSNAGGNK